MKKFTTNLAGRELVLEIGKFATLSSGSVMVRYGDSAVLATVVVAPEPKDVDFFPLTVNYEERLYAVGKIPGGFIKREGRPSEKAILNSRLLDRPIRPLFPDNFRHELQVATTVMSVDQDCAPEVAAAIGASVSLMLSPAPFEGPIASVIVGMVDDKFIINPTSSQLEKSKLHLVVAGTYDAINMVEAGAQELSEQIMLEAIMFGHAAIQELIVFQNEIIKQFEVEQLIAQQAESVDDLRDLVYSLAQDKIAEAVKVFEKKERQQAIDIIKSEVRDKVLTTAENELENSEKRLNNLLNELVKHKVRDMILNEHIRPDGRKPDEIRPLSSEIDILPRTHGSGLFRRGQTQVLSVCTLGALGDVQVLDGLDLEESKRFMHHYNFPPYSVGEARPMRPPGRREIGHGALGARALEPIIPTEEKFPYTIRLVSEVLESNGSSSQASICASILALMDAGVPIKAPVAGIAMGLIKENDKVCVLTDIQGMEDHLGDMDFKVAGTKDGITALQMDIKISGIDNEILKDALIKAKNGRLTILANLEECIKDPKQELSKYAPKITTMRINPDKIRDVIGPSGRMINKIIEETGVKIDIEQDGRVYISSQDQKQNETAKSIIEGLVREIAVDEVYEGTVKRIEAYGVFVEIAPGKDGLVHISQIDKERVEKIEGLFELGDKMKVKVIDIDKQGKIKLSRKAILT